jgi:hypothetical protein
MRCGTKTKQGRVAIRQSCATDSNGEAHTFVTIVTESMRAATVSSQGACYKSREKRNYNSSPCSPTALDAQTDGTI